MGAYFGRFSPVYLVLALVLSLSLFGCIGQVPSGGGPAPGATDVFGSQLEALNGDIYAAKDQATVANLTARVAALESSATGNASYQKYLPLIRAQARSLSLINASIVYAQAGDSIRKGGIDCSRDYRQMEKTLKDADDTKTAGLSFADSYLSSNPGSSASLLVTLMNSTDTKGMFLFAALLEEQRAYECPGPATPAKTYPTPLTESEAAKLVVDEFTGPENYYVYSIHQPLDAGTVVSVKDPTGDTTNRTMGSKTWFFMLDQTPDALWGHDVKFVYVDADNAQYYSTDEVSYPVISGLSYWLSSESRTDPKWVDYPANATFGLNATFAPSFRTFVDGKLYSFGLADIANIPAGTDCGTIDCCKGVGKNKGLIVNGDDQKLFYKDTQTMYDYLTKTAGLSPGDVTTLTADKELPQSNGVTSLKTLKETISKLANDSKCCDKIFIYITGHGIEVKFWEYKNKATGETKYFNRPAALKLDPAQWEYTGMAFTDHNIDVNPYSQEKMSDGSTVTHGSPDGGDMWASDLGELLNQIKSCYVTLMYDSCHSGYAAPQLAGKGRTVITTSGTGSSYGYPGGGGVGAGGAWNSLWILAHGTFKDEADSNNDGTVSDREAFDFANRNVNSALKGGRNQTATWTGPQPPCTCCHVQCDASTNYICNVVAGDGTNDPRCKKVGDGCTYTVPIGNGTQIQNITENITGNGSTTTGGGGNETFTGTRTCGNNVTVPQGGCQNDADCPQYRYCDKQTCTCKQYPLICGDGHIAAGEACDPKAVPNGCPENEACDANCRCSTPIVCGDGVLGGTEQCEAGIPCTGSGMTCNLNTCQCEQGVTENVTGGGTTTGGGTINQTPGGGVTTPQPYCGDGIVNGNEQCEINSQCPSGYHCSACQCAQTPAVCGDGIINGNEQCDPRASPAGCYGNSVCSSGCTCVSPPTLNCDNICSQTSGAQSFGGGYSDAVSCANGVKNSFSPVVCYTICTYSWYYKVSNIAGSASCCCGMKKQFACSNCPAPAGTQPYCPGTSICDQNAPSWYVPPA